jgi:DNA-binding GntR family transcriptional regulator
MSDGPFHDAASDLEQTLVSTLAAAPEPLGRTALRDRLRVRNERLGEALTNLAATGAIVRVGERWAVPVPSSTAAPERNASA